MDNIRAVRAFVEVCDAGSFVKAAQRMNCSTTKISRLIRELEDAFGVPLLVRSTRHVHVSSDGASRLEACRRIVADMDALLDNPLEERPKIRGELKVATNTAFAQKRLIPLLPEFLDSHPDVKIIWQLSDARVDLSQQGVDMAIRIAHLQDSQMVARPLGRVQICLVAAPALLEREGHPAKLHDIARMSCSVCTVPQFRNRWPLKPDAVVDGPVWADCGEASRESVIAGLGVGFLPDFLVEDAVADGRLVQLFPEEELIQLNMAILYPGRHQISPAASAFGEFLVQKFDVTG